MNQDLIFKQKLKNAEGKRLLKKTKLEYCKIIIELIQKYPNIINELLDELEVNEKDFFDYLSGEKSANITFYDQAINLINEKIYKK